MKKLWAMFSYFLHARKCWRGPRQSDMLIYDACGQQFFLEYIQQWTPELLHMRGEQINMPVLFVSLFRSGKISDAYVDCFIEKVRPRLIVTFVDNTPGFYVLSGRHPTIKTLFIQNGMRGYYLDAFEYLDCIKPPDLRLKVDYMMTVGSHVGAEYAKYIEGAVVPMGSLINNLTPKTHAKKSGSIAYVSQYRISEGMEMGGRFVTKHEFFEKADRCALSFLLKYAKDHSKTLFIIPSIIPSKNWYSENDLQGERRYYNELLGHTFDFFECSHLLACYDAADSAEVVVGIDSTLGFESAVRGNKTAIFSIRSHLMGLEGYSFGWPVTYPDEGPFWTNLPDHTVFERILDHLFAINEEQWQAELSEHEFAKIMAHDPGNSILQSVLQKELGAAPNQRH